MNRAQMDSLFDQLNYFLASLEDLDIDPDTVQLDLALKKTIGSKDWNAGVFSDVKVAKFLEQFPETVSTKHAKKVRAKFDKFLAKLMPMYENAREIPAAKMPDFSFNGGPNYIYIKDAGKQVGAIPVGDMTTTTKYMKKYAIAPKFVSFDENSKILTKINRGLTPGQLIVVYLLVESKGDENFINYQIDYWYPNELKMTATASDGHIYSIADKRIYKVIAESVFVFV